jgi:hypothetical protein
MVLLRRVIGDGAVDSAELVRVSSSPAKQAYPMAQIEREMNADHNRLSPQTCHRVM